MQIYICTYICKCTYTHVYMQTCRMRCQNAKRNIRMSASEEEAHILQHTATQCNAATSLHTHTHMYIYIHHVLYIYAGTYTYIHVYICRYTSTYVQKRPTKVIYKRDLQKRPTKETYNATLKRQLGQRPRNQIPKSDLQ